jgi:aspartate/methionine/tyrosine aminotransferase
LATQADAFSYTDRQGLKQLRQAVSVDFKKNYGFSIGEHEILITAGCNEAFCVAACAVLDQGDEAIIPRPYYFNHPMWLDIIGVHVIEAECSANAMPDLDQINQLVSDRTRVVVLVSPGNPTGANIPSSDLEEFVKRLGSRGVYVVLDETYRLFSEDGPKAFESGNFDKFPNLIRLLSFSKEFAIPGLRIGAACAHEALTRQMLKIHDCISICAPHIGQKAVLHGLKVGRAWQDEIKQSVRRKRKLLIEAINKVPTGFEVISSGGFFVWVRHPFQRMTSLPNVDAPNQATSQPTKGGIQSPTPLWGGIADPGENHEPDGTYPPLKNGQQLENLRGMS